MKPPLRIIIPPLFKTRLHLFLATRNLCARHRQTDQRIPSFQLATVAMLPFTVDRAAMHSVLSGDTGVSRPAAKCYFLLEDVPLQRQRVQRYQVVPRKIRYCVRGLTLR